MVSYSGPLAGTVLKGFPGNQSAFEIRSIYSNRTVRTIFKCDCSFSRDKFKTNRLLIAW